MSALGRWVIALAAICAPNGDAAAQAGGPPAADLVIRATEYRLSLPQSVRAGWTTVRFHSDGHEFHHATFLRVRDPAAADSALRALATWERDWDRPVPASASAGGVEGGTLRPGWRLVAVENRGPAEHVTEFVRLRRDRHIADLFKRNGDDAIEGTIGGVPRLEVGERSYAWLNSEPGTYAILCPLRASGGEPHERRGMVAELTVR